MPAVLSVLVSRLFFQQYPTRFSIIESLLSVLIYDHVLYRHPQILPSISIVCINYLAPHKALKALSSVFLDARTDRR